MTGRRVGQLAKAAGVTVRTLHYYEEIGLLRLGLLLEEVARALDDPAWNLRSALGTHLRELDRRQEAMARLRGRISHLVAQDAGTEASKTDDLLMILEEMTVLDTTVQRRIALLVYRDLQAAYDYLVRVFGLGPGQLTNGDDGRVVHGELQAGDGVVWLHPELASMGLSSPAVVGVSTACMAVMVDDVDAHFRRSSEQGARIEYEPVDQPYGYREYGARDNEGHLWSFMKPLD